VAELPQVTLDGAHGGGPQAQGDLVQVAVGGLGVGAGDTVPAGQPHRDPAGAGQGVDHPVVVEGGLQPVQHGGRAASGVGPSALAVGIQQQLASGKEALGVDAVHGGPGRGGQHGQHVPLQRGVGRGGGQPPGGLLEPQPCRRLVAGRRRAQPHPCRHDEAGVYLKVAGHDQPGGKRRGMLGLGRGQPLIGTHGHPAAGAIQAAAERRGGLPGRRPDPQPGRLHRLAVLLDQAGYVCRQRRWGRHHAPPIVCAWMASTARRYSSANQSLVRCR
jgi:hypothetical protein